MQHFSLCTKKLNIEKEKIYKLLYVKRETTKEKKVGNGREARI